MFNKIILFIIILIILYILINIIKEKNLNEPFNNSNYYSNNIQNIIKEKKLKNNVYPYNVNNSNYYDTSENRNMGFILLNKNINGIFKSTITLGS